MNAVEKGPELMTSVPSPTTRGWDRRLLDGTGTSRTSAMAANRSVTGSGRPLGRCVQYSSAGPLTDDAGDAGLSDVTLILSLIAPVPGERGNQGDGADECRLTRLVRGEQRAHLAEGLVGDGLSVTAPGSSPLRSPSSTRPRLIRIPDPLWYAFGRVCGRLSTDRTNNALEPMKGRVLEHGTDGARAPLRPSGSLLSAAPAGAGRSSPRLAVDSLSGRCLTQPL